MWFRLRINKIKVADGCHIVSPILNNIKLIRYFNQSDRIVDVYVFVKVLAFFAVCLVKFCLGLAEVLYKYNLIIIIIIIKIKII